MRHIVISLVLLLSACDGGSSEPSQSTIIPVGSGRYAIASESASLLMTDLQTIYVSQSDLGFGDWDYSGSEPHISLQLLEHPIDDLGNEFPSAKSSGQTKIIMKSALVLASPSAPDIATLPRNWQFRNLYRFGTAFLDYTIQIDIDTGGVLTGFDVNGCNFTGNLKARSDGVPMYDATIISTNCSSTFSYLDNAEYIGYAFLMNGMLEIAAINRDQKIGLAFELSAR